MRATKATHIQTRHQSKPTGKNSRQRKTNENQRPAPRKAAPAKSADYSQLAARATNDAVRDWDLTSDALTWPQGLKTLLGYSPDNSNRTIGFWQQNIHEKD